MKKLSIVLVTAALGVMMYAGGAHAVTAAGTTISNTATANYTVGGGPLQTATSGPVTFKVAQLVNVAVTNVSGLSVQMGDSGKAIKFTVTNTGNATETFTLSIDNLLGGDQFDPTAAVPAIYMDTDNSGGFNGADIPTTTLTLLKGETKTVFLVNDIPVGLASGNTGNTQLTAQNNTYNAGAVGTIYALGAGGPNGVDVILGVADGKASANGVYTISPFSVTVIKGSVVSNPSNPALGATPVPGSTVTYTLTANLAGSGTATALKIIDPIPDNTTFVSGSIKLDGVDVPDASGYDTTTVPGFPRISVLIGDTAAVASKVVTFQVTIN